MDGCIDQTTTKLMLGAAPNFTQGILEICAEDFLDGGKGLAAAGQFLGDDLHVVGAIQVGDVRVAVFAGRPDVELFAAGNVGVEIGDLRRREHDFLDGAVGADPDVVRAADVDGVDEVIEDVLARRNCGRGDEVGH